MLGLHKKLKNVSVEGNPLKSIRRPIIAKGSAGILAYLGDRYIEENDGAAEEWAIEQNKADKVQEKELYAAVEVEKEKEKEEVLRKKYAQEQEDAKNYCVIGGVQKQEGATTEAAAAETAEAPKEENGTPKEEAEAKPAEAQPAKEEVVMEEEKKEEAVPEAVVQEAAPEVPAAEEPAQEEAKVEAEETKDTVEALPEPAAQAEAAASQKVHVSASSISFGDDAPDTPVKRPARAAAQVDAAAN